MNKQIRIFLTFILTFFIAYLIVGYMSSNVFAHIKWEESATLSDKLREYYIRTFSVNIIPALVLTAIPTVFLTKRSKKRI